MNRVSREQVVILDFGGQYSQVIARRVREAGVFCRVIPYDTPVEKVQALQPRGLILSGGPATVYEPGAPMPDASVLDLGVPVLGICYGMQVMAHLMGGKVSPCMNGEYGQAQLELVREDDLWEGLGPCEMVWMSHGVAVEDLPPGFSLLGRTAQSPVAAMGHCTLPLYGLQFHPEVGHTPRGQILLQNFLYRVAGCQGSWSPASFVQEQVEAVRTQVGEGQVLCALSGGVDSGVAAALVHRAVGDQLTCVFVDHGLLRQGEREQVLETFGSHFGMNLVLVDARERFLQRLSGVRDPEAKRRIIGEAFIRIFEEEARKLGDISYLVQGTIYPDVIESGGGTGTRVIKSHHNVGGLPERMDLALVEPLRELFKDEVRQVGSALGLPDSLVWRHPFPGPGLAVRIVGEVTPERLRILQKADAILVEEVERAEWYHQLWQVFAVLPGFRSVGVMGDERTYGYTVAVRAVTSDDAMTADWARLPHHLLSSISSRIVNEVEGVNRVVYDITSKPPATIEWE